LALLAPGGSYNFYLILENEKINSFNKPVHFHLFLLLMLIFSSGSNKNSYGVCWALFFYLR